MREALRSALANASLYPVEEREIFNSFWELVDEGINSLAGEKALRNLSQAKPLPKAMVQ